MDANWFTSLQASYLLPEWLITEVPHFLRAGGVVTTTLTLEQVIDLREPIYDRPANDRALRSAPFEGRYWSSANNPKFVADDLAYEIETTQFERRLTGRKRVQLIEAVLCLVMNFYRLHVTDTGRVLGLPLDRKYFKDSHVNHRSIRQSIRGLVALGYVRIAKKHSWNARTKSGKATRYEALPKLVELFSDYSFEIKMIELRPRKHLCEVRPPKHERRKTGAPLTLPWPNALRKLRADRDKDVRTINEALGAQFTAIHLTDDDLRDAFRKQSRPVNLFQYRLHRVFVIDPYKVGRLVGGWWQTAPKAIRQHIRMSAPGKHPSHTVEVDYDAHHIRMLYAQEGKPCPAVPYSIDDRTELWGEELPKDFRAIVKTLTLAMINASSRPAALKAIRYKVKNEFRKWAKKNPGHAPLPESDRIDAMVALMWPESGIPPLAELRDAIEVCHAPIAHRFYTGAGRQLMFEDSEIAVAVMLRMIDDYGVAPLPMHDSFIVHHNYEEQLNQVMAGEYAARIGAPIPMKVSYGHQAQPNPSMTAKTVEEFEEAWELERDEYRMYYTLFDAWASPQPEGVSLRDAESEESEVARTMDARRDRLDA